MSTQNPSLNAIVVAQPQRADARSDVYRYVSVSRSTGEGLAESLRETKSVTPRRASAGPCMGVKLRQRGSNLAS